MKKNNRLTIFVQAIPICMAFFLFFPFASVGQSLTDTLYYDAKWNRCKSSFNSIYYRVIQKESVADSNGRFFTDYYRTGEKQGEGHLLSLGTTGDNTTVFDGRLFIYRKNGQIQTEMNYNKGVLDGRYIEYSSDGEIIKHLNYKNGQFDGNMSMQAYDGSIFSSKAANGIPDTSYYTLSNRIGNSVKIEYLGNIINPNSPEKSGLKTFYRNNKAIQYYLTSEGLTYAVTVSKVKEYGKWYMVEITISNETPYAIEFDASKVSAIELKPSLSPGKLDTNYLSAWSMEKYMKRVKTRQNWGEALYAFSAGLAAGSSAYSYSSSSTVSYSPNYGTTYSYSNTTTYNPDAQRRATIEASQNLSIIEQDNWQSRKYIQENYMGKNTVFPGEILSGYVLIKRSKAKYLTVRIEHEGVGLLYDWDVSK